MSLIRFLMRAATDAALPDVGSGEVTQTLVKLSGPNHLLRVCVVLQNEECARTDEEKERERDRAGRTEGVTVREISVSL